MRILWTGVNRDQAQQRKEPPDVFTWPSTFLPQELKHHTHKFAFPDKAPLEWADIVIFGLGYFQDPDKNYPALLTLMSKCRKQGIPLLGYIYDPGISCKPMRLPVYDFVNSIATELVKKRYPSQRWVNTLEVMNEAWRLYDGDWPPMFTSGWDFTDPARLSGVFGFAPRPLNPSAFVPRYSIVKARHRLKKWVWAAAKPELGAWWRSVGWPIEMHFPGPMWIPEAELAQVYASSWGMLMHEYPVFDGHWYRARYDIAAYCGIIVAAPPSEGALLGSSYDLSIPYIESLPDKALRYLAQAQREDLAKHQWSKDRFIAEFDKLLEETVRA